MKPKPGNKKQATFHTDAASLFYAWLNIETHLARRSLFNARPTTRIIEGVLVFCIDFEKLKN